MADGFLESLYTRVCTDRLEVRWTQINVGQGCWPASSEQAAAR